MASSGALRRDDGGLLTEKVRVPNEDGDALSGVMVSRGGGGEAKVDRRGGAPQAHGVQPKRGGRVVVLLHGLYQHKNINMLRPYGARMAADADLDVSTFRFDCRGLGESEGTTSFTPHYINLADLEAAIAYLEGPERQMEVVCIFGYSAGGNVAVMYAAKHPGHVPFVTVHSSRFTMDGIRATLQPHEVRQPTSPGAAYTPVPYSRM